jgi:hypothetical protein
MIFYAVIRAALKQRPTLNADTLHYIEALEQVAKKAVLVWATMRSEDTQAQTKAADALHEALQKVDFMNE